MRTARSLLTSAVYAAALLCLPAAATTLDLSRCADSCVGVAGCVDSSARCVCGAASHSGGLFLDNVLVCVYLRCRDDLRRADDAFLGPVRRGCAAAGRPIPDSALDEAEDTLQALLSKLPPPATTSSYSDRPPPATTTTNPSTGPPRGTSSTDPTSSSDSTSPAPPTTATTSTPTGPSASSSGTSSGTSSSTSSSTSTSTKDAFTGPTDTSPFVNPPNRATAPRAAWCPYLWAGSLLVAALLR